MSKETKQDGAFGYWLKSKHNHYQK